MTNIIHPTNFSILLPLRFSLFSVFLLSLTSGYAETCNFVLDLNDTFTYSTGYLNQGEQPLASSKAWEVKGNDSLAIEGFLEPVLNFPECSKTDLLIAFYAHHNQQLAQSDFIALQVSTDLSPHWKNLSRKDGNFLNQMISGQSYHDAIISTEMYDDINSVVIRLVVRSLSAPILIKNGELYVNVARLPVEFASVNLETDFDGTVALDWAIDGEINASHFEVERSLDGENWLTIEKINAKNLIDLSKYQTLDYPPLAEAYYYRLKMVDLYDTHAYSKPSMIRLMTDPAAAFSPSQSVKEGFPRKS